MKNRRKVEVEKFYYIGEGVDHLVEAGFEIIAMCLGGDVAGHADDALGVETRIEGGQLPGHPGNLVDQANDRSFFLPDIAQKTRQDVGLGGKFAGQRLAREDCVEEREPLGRLLRQRHRQQARERTRRFPVGFARPGEPERRASGERSAKLGNKTGPGRRMESVEIGRLLFQPLRAERGGSSDAARRRGGGDLGGDVFGARRQIRYGAEDRDQKS